MLLFYRASGAKSSENALSVALKFSGRKQRDLAPRLPLSDDDLSAGLLHILNAWEASRDRRQEDGIACPERQRASPKVAWPSRL